MAATRALVVGGTNGIGYGIACRLAAEATTASVIISGRTRPQTLPNPKMEFRRLDASSMREIKQYADAFKSAVAPEQPQLDLLVMSQGIMTTSGRTETEEGIDRKMAVHYYGKQLLIRELLPVLKKDARVLIVYDGWSGNPDKLHWEDLDLKTHYGLGTAANHSIVMTDAMVQYFASEQRKKNQSSNKAQVQEDRRHFLHAYPGGVRSNLAVGLPWYLRPVMKLTAGLVGVSPDTCAQRLLGGTSTVTEAGEREGRFWSNIDNHGRLLEKKKVWGDDELKRIADHTWALIDGGMAKTA